MIMQQSNACTVVPFFFSSSSPLLLSLLSSHSHYSGLMLVRRHTVIARQPYMAAISEVKQSFWWNQP